MADEGWFTDPYRQHQSRWMSDGVASKLVRDDGVESYDDPPDTPYVEVPVQIVNPQVAEPDPRYDLPAELPQKSWWVIGLCLLAAVVWGAGFMLQNLLLFDPVRVPGWANIVGMICLVAAVAIPGWVLLRRRRAKKAGSDRDRAR